MSTFLSLLVLLFFSSCCLGSSNIRFIQIFAGFPYIPTTAASSRTAIFRGFVRNYLRNLSRYVKLNWLNLCDIMQPIISFPPIVKNDLNLLCIIIYLLLWGRYFHTTVHWSHLPHCILKLPPVLSPSWSPIVEWSLHCNRQADEMRRDRRQTLPTVDWIFAALTTAADHRMQRLERLHHWSDAGGIRIPSIAERDWTSWASVLQQLTIWQQIGLRPHPFSYCSVLGILDRLLDLQVYWLCVGLAVARSYRSTKLLG